MKFTRPVTTRIEDFDHHGCTKPEAILSYLENAADRHSASVSDDTIRKSLGGTAWILTQWRVEVITPPTWQDSLFVETWVVDKGASVRSHRQFLLKHADGTILVRAEATLALLDLASRKVRRISEALVKCYHAEDEAVFAGELPRMPEPTGETEAFAMTLRRGDLDFNGHVHNLRYLELAMEALPEEVCRTRRITALRIAYRVPLMAGDRVRIRAAQSEMQNDSWDIGIYNDTQLCTLVRLTMG